MIVLRNKFIHKYIYKKSGQRPSLRVEAYNICKFIIFSKNILVIPGTLIYLALPIELIYIYILMSVTIVFSILFKLS